MDDLQQHSFSCTVCGDLFTLPGPHALHEAACKRHQQEKLDRRALSEEFKRDRASGRVASSRQKPRPQPFWETLPPASFDVSPPLRASSSTTASSLPPIVPPLPAEVPATQGPSRRSHSTPAPQSIRTTFHPYSRRQPTLSTIDEYRSQSQAQMDTSLLVGAPSGPSLHSAQPWYPFRTRSDFEFASLAVDAKMSRKSIMAMMKLIQRCSKQEDSLTFSTYKSLQDAWGAAEHLVTPWQSDTVDAVYNGETLNFPVYYKSIMDWIVRLTSNQDLINEWQWDAMQQEVYDGKTWQSFITEPYTASDFFNIQSCLPPGSTPLGIILYADKTQLSNFSGIEGHPVYAKIANLPSRIRNGSGLGGGQVVGWLPKVTGENVPKRGKSHEWVDMKHVVWHKCFVKILESIREPSRRGMAVRCADDIIRVLYPFILILSADYEEQALLAAIRGVNGQSPCPVCIVDINDQAVFQSNWVRRSGKQNLKLVEEVLREMGIPRPKPKRKRKPKQKATDADEDTAAEHNPGDSVVGGGVVEASNMPQLVDDDDDEDEADEDLDSDDDGDSDNDDDSDDDDNDDNSDNDDDEDRDNNDDEDDNNERGDDSLDGHGDADLVDPLDESEASEAESTDGDDATDDSENDDSSDLLEGDSDSEEGGRDLEGTDLEDGEASGDEGSPIRTHDDANDTDSDDDLNADYQDNQNLDNPAANPDVDPEAYGRSRLDAHSLRPVRNAFMSIALSDPHRALTFDRLHNYPGGLAKTHIVKLIQTCLSKRSKKDQERINKAAAKFPTWPGLIRFRDVTTPAKYQDSNHWEDLSRVLLYLLPDIVQPSDKVLASLLRCLRLFNNLNTYSSFELHTSARIKEIRMSLKRFALEIHKFSKLYRSKTWNFPKMHVQMHLPHDIVTKGATKHSSTKPFEFMHKGLKVYFSGTNFRDTDRQILKKDVQHNSLQVIKARVAAFDRQQAKKQNRREPTAGGECRFGRLILGSPQGPAKPSLLSSIDLSLLLGEHCFPTVEITPETFIKVLKSFYRVNARQWNLPEFKDIRIQEYRNLLVSFASEETYLEEQNYLRCSPSFYNRPRYDCVIVETHSGVLFARLLLLFTLSSSTEDSTPMPMAMILPYDGPVTRAERMDDWKGSQQYRVRPPTRPAPEIIFAQSIVRGALLIPCIGRVNDFYVFDVLDGDMFLRVQREAESFLF